MNWNVVAGLANLSLFSVCMAVGWFIPAIVAVVCAAFSLCLAAMDRA